MRDGERGTTHARAPNITACTLHLIGILVLFPTMDASSDVDANKEIIKIR